MDVLLAKPYQPGKHDIEGWWASEKLDGVRAYWDGENFLSRNGNIFHAPPWFKDHLPRHQHLDGELYMGRGRFQDTVSAVRKLHPIGDEWRQVTYLVFDAPNFEGTFEDRMGLITANHSLYLEELSGPDSGPVCWEPVKHWRVWSLNQVMDEAQHIWQHGGEGLMFRQPGSMYERKRSSTLLKLKNVVDEVVTVIGGVPGKGKHKGKMGALVCQTDSGVTFNVGTGFSDDDREKDWKIGMKVKIAYSELTRDNVPRHPRFLCTHKGD